MTTNTDVHTCSYYCERPGCIRAQRDELRERLEAVLAQQPEIGEEIMVNAGHDVFILPLQPSGLSSGPRFVVHVPAPAQKFKVGDRVVACETFYHDEVQGIRVGAYGTVRESRYNGEIFLVDFDGITPSKNEHDGAWEMFAHQLELAPDTRPAAPAAQAPRACTCHPDDRPDGPCRERYAASECQALAAQAQAANADALDAARYRWLRDREIPEWLDLWHQNPDRIDAAIDQAMRE